MTQLCRHGGLRTLALLAVLVSTPAWAGTPVVGTDSVGPLSTHIYTLRIPPPVGDTLPPGIGGPGSIFYLFAVFDTGADRVGISEFDANFLDFFNPVVPSFLDVRLWGSNRIDPVGLGAPLDTPEAEVEDVALDLLPPGFPTLVGGPVTNVVVAHIEYDNLVTRGPFPALDPCGGNASITSPTTEFFNDGDPNIPTPAAWFDLVPVGNSLPGPDGTSRGQRYEMADMIFENGNARADSHSFNFLYDTGNTTTQITPAVAAALGIDLGSVDATVCIGGDPCQPGCVGGDFLNGYIVDRTILLSSDATEEYRINNPLVFVETPGGLGGWDANIGTNYFETTDLVFDGPRARFGLNLVPEPTSGWTLAAGIVFLLTAGRRRSGQR